MSAPQWQWDPNRQAYYYYDSIQSAYIYQNGQRIYMGAAQPTQYDQGQANGARNGGGNSSPSAPRTLPSISQTEEDPSNALSSLLQQTSLSPMTGSYGYPYGAYNSNYRTPGFSPPGSGVNSSVGGTAGSNNSSQVIQTQPNDQITDARLLKLGLGARGRISGVFSDDNKLYPEYQVRRPGKKFFKQGKVLKVLWPEILGQTNESITVTSDTRYGEGIATKIRWFIVVMEGKDSCTCLPINTYKGQGVAKKGIVKWQHAIAYSSIREPEPQLNETPGPHENGPMMKGIRIKAKHRVDKLHPMSRIDFARMYTLEHNVKVYDFGDVHRDSLQCLIDQWLLVIRHGVKSNPILSPTDEDDAEDSSEEEDDDDEDEEEEEEGVVPPPRPATVNSAWSRGSSGSTGNMVIRSKTPGFHQLRHGKGKSRH